jgi:hypothetical protein
MDNIRILSATNPELAQIDGFTLYRNPYGYFIAAFFSFMAVLAVFWMALIFNNANPTKEIYLLYGLGCFCAVIFVFTLKRAIITINPKAWVLKLNRDYLLINIRNYEYNAYMKLPKNDKVALIPKILIKSIIPVNYRGFLCTEDVQLSMINSLELELASENYAQIKGTIEQEANLIAKAGGDLAEMNVDIPYKSMRAGDNTILIPFIVLLKGKKLYEMLKFFGYPLSKLDARKLTVSEWADINLESHNRHKR